MSTFNFSKNMGIGDWGLGVGGLGGSPKPPPPPPHPPHPQGEGPD